MKPATPLPWEWWTSNSHHRLSSKATGKDGDVLHAYVARDGMPCINVTQGDEEYIVRACNAYPRLVEALRTQCARWEELEKQHTDSDGWKEAEGRAILRELGELANRPRSFQAHREDQMNAVTKEQQLIVPEGSRLPRPSVSPDASALMKIIDRAAMDPNFDVAKLEKLLEVRERWEAAEARKAYNEAFSAFKAEAVQAIRNKQVTDGPLKGKSYAELFSVVNAVTPALSRHGLSHSWRITRDEKDWIEVTCTLTHVLGHSETAVLGGPPDVGGAKNAIQARASTITYLERYTLKAVCGIAEQGDDTDGNGKKEGMSEADYQGFVKRIKATTKKDAAKAVWQEGLKACVALGDDATAKELKKVLLEHSAFIDGADKV